MTGVEISPLQSRDLRRCADLEALIFRGDGPWSYGSFHMELINPATRYFAARVDGRLVGYAGIALLGRAGDGESEVRTIAVDPAVQGRGVGRALFNELLAVAEAFGGEVHLEVRTDNEPAIAMYTSAGFAVSGLRPKYYESGADAYTMRRKEPA